MRGGVLLGEEYLRGIKGLLKELKIICGGSGWYRTEIKVACMVCKISDRCGREPENGVYPLIKDKRVKGKGT